MKTQWLSKFISALMIVMLGLAALPVTPAMAASTGLFSPTSCSSATWTNPNNAISSNNVRATAGGDGNEMECSFNLPAIPAGNGIAGIEVTVEGTGSNSRDVLVELSWDAGASYTGGDPTVNLGGTEQVYTVGGTTDTWGRTWDVGDFTAANFRVKVYNDGDFGTSSIDHVQVNVHYFPSYTITATAGAGGTITPSGAVNVIENSDQSFDITPNTSFIVSDVVVDLASVGRANAHTFTNVTGNHTISATFDGGWSQPSDDTDSGWSNEANAYVSDNSYGVANNNNEDAEFFDFGLSLPGSATINGIEVAVEGNSTGSREVAVDLSSGGGFTTGDPSTTFTNGGADATFLFGGSADLWGRAWTPANIANLRVRLTANNGSGDVNIDQVQVKVHFTAVSHTITATAGAGGTITPSGAVNVYEGLDQSFDITPNTSFVVADVVVDLASAGRPNAYTFTNVTGNHTISTTFDGGWSQPSADTDNGWSNEANAYVSDNNYGVANNNNEDAEFFGFGISIPGGSTINGIEVAVEGNATGSREVAVDLSSGGGFTTGDPSTTFTNGGADATFLFGGSADLWGRAWTTANIANLRVRLTSNNGSGDVNIDQIQVKVHYTLPNTAPTGGNDSVTPNEDTLYTFQVSDFTYNDANSDPFAGIRVTSLETAGDLECGSVDVALNGTCADVTTLTFNPVPNANGTPYATFQFEVFDGTAYSASSYTMTVNVTAVDDVSVANDDTPTVGEDSGANTIDVRGNDTDIDGAVELIQSVTQPTNGTVAITNGGADLTYAPNANYCNGGTPTDDFTYTLAGGDSATVAVTVTCVDDTSVAIDDTPTVSEDSGANTINVRGNDTDIDGAVELIQSVTQPTNGSVVITNGGADLTYAPNANYCNGGSPTDDFTYTLAGGDSATVAVTVTCVDDPSVATDDTPTVGEDSGANTINVRGNDTDIDSAVELIQSVTQPTNGTVAITNGGADLTYAPNANYCNGGSPTDDFTYTLAGGDSATVAVTVTCVDDASVANDDTPTVGEDSGANTIDVRGNDSDIDSSVELIQSVTQPTNGAVAITNGGQDLTYTPSVNYCNGGTPTDDFTYTLAGSDSATVAVTVTCVDDPSTANDDTATVWEDSGTNTIDVRGNDTDVDSSVELIQSVTQPANGTVVVTNGGQDLTYQPDAEYCNGGTPTDDFSYTLTGGDSATVAVTVNCQTGVTPSIIADNKIYNGDAAATFTCSLSGVTPPDDVSCSGGTASFDNENVGAGKLVTAAGLGLSGADAAMYELTTTSATDNADITARDLNVTATGVNKVYDGNTNATVTLSDDSIITDDVVVSYTSASFLDPDVGNTKPVTVTGISISGGLDAGNYSLVNSTANTTADITIASQTITITQNAPASAANGTTFDVAATASSGLPVTITTSGSCSGGDTDGGATITMTSGTGTCSVFYNQAGNSNYDPAPQLQEDVNATESPLFTSADNTAFDLGFAGSFNITATGNPQTMTISVSGTLPTGITFADNGDGTASFSGTPGVGTAGVYNLILTADNGIVPNGIQNFTLTVKNGPIIGADGVNSTPDTGNGSISENEIISTTLGITQLTVEFIQDVYDPAGDSDPDDVTNPANYMLARSATGTFATTSCVLGVTAPDVSISVDSVTYANNSGSGPFIATLNVNSGLPLNVEGFYRLYTCGTTSIVDAVNTGLILAGDGVNPGTDFVRNFRISAPTSGGGGGGGGGDDTVASAISQGGLLIPVTGFAPNQSTKLAAQTTEYAATKLALDIPTLGLNLPIVGVDFKDTGWDVTWLGANAGYLEGSAYPTWTGNTVLTGHVTDPNGKPGPFAYVNELKPGEKIYIHNNGFTYVYEVRQSSLILPSSVKTLFKHEDDTWLSLVTCENFNTKTNAFSNRRMVRAVLISIIPAK